MGQSSFLLRLASSLQEEARKTAKSEGVSLNQLISLVIAEKISVLHTARRRTCIFEPASS